MDLSIDIQSVEGKIGTYFALNWSKKCIFDMEFYMIRFRDFQISMVRMHVMLEFQWCQTLFSIYSV